MFSVQDIQQDDDLKPPQFFQSTYDESILNGTKVYQCFVDFALENNTFVEGQMILYQEYIASRMGEKVFFVELDLTITFEADHQQLKLTFRDTQRQLQLSVLFHKEKQFNSFFNLLKRYLFQTNFQSNYEIMRKIGHGKTSLVYEVKNKISDVIYAGKFYSNVPSSIKRQIDVLKELEHPNLVYFHEMFISNGQVYLIMDYQDGGTLLDRINNKEPMTMKQKINFLVDMLNAFQFLRIKNIVHRDLKPENILYSNKQKCYKITDFSLAIYEDQPINRLVGTPGYIAPELFQSQKQIVGNQYTDIYSLGLIYYQIATKQTYFKGQNFQNILKANKKAQSLKKRKYSKQHISDLEYDVLRMMIRTEVQDRKLSLQILQSHQLRKLIKIYALDKQNSSLSCSSSQKTKSRKNSDIPQIQKQIDQQNFMKTMKRILRFKSSS